MPSFGVRLYRFLNRAGVAGGSLAGWGARPEGVLVWLHAPRAQAARGFPPLIAALRRMKPGAEVLVTCPEPLELQGATVLPPPPDSGEGARAFLRHWRPDLGIWAEGQLRPVLVEQAGRMGVPMLLVEGHGPGLRGARWWPRLMPGVIAAFAHILVIDDLARRLFLRAGAAPARVQVTGALEEPSHLLPVNEAERASLARSIGTRPVWLAVGVPPEEDAALAEAHLAALRMAHRLLLIHIPDTPARAAELTERLRLDYGLAVASRSHDEEIDEEVQVYLADAEELGLWYRLAPVTLIGGTLLGGGAARHPYEAAAMGSAIIHGLQTGSAAPAFDRLMRAGGSRLVPGAGDLGETLGDLLAVDRAARLAQAAWGVSSAGAEATELTLRLATQLLTARAALTGDAGPKALAPAP